MRDARRETAARIGGSAAARTHAALACVISIIAVLLTSCSISTEEVDVPTVSQARAEAPMFGAFTYGGVWGGMEPVLRLESQLGRPLDIVHWFMSWDHAYDAALVASVVDGGRIPLISWQPVNQSVADIAAGAQDDYLRGWARGVRDAGAPVYIRPFPEMNGEWAPWNGDPEALRIAWRRMAAIFDAQGATNVRWVFSPNVTDEPRTESNRMESYYPGEDVVDVLALDGYNWGTTREWSSWTSFEDVFRGGYDRIERLGPQPIWFAEMASADVGGDKAAWVRDMFASTAFPRLQALIWFDEDKEADWRIASTPEVVDAFRVGLGGGDLGLGGTLAALR